MANYKALNLFLFSQNLTNNSAIYERNMKLDTLLLEILTIPKRKRDERDICDHWLLPPLIIGVIH